MNTVNLIARIVKDLELKTSAAGVEILNFTVACQRDYKNADGKYDADFINVVAFRQTASFIARFFGKGDKIAIVGSITTRNYEKDGHKVYVTEILVKTAEFVTDKNSSAPKANPEANKDDRFFPADEDSSSLPFDL